MRRLNFIAGFLVVLACGGASVQAQDPQIENINSEPNISGWTVNKTETTLAFSGIQSGEAFTGSFSDFDAVINFDPENLADAKVVVTIDMNSAQTDDLESTNALPSKEWFNIRKFPVAKFEASEFKHLSGDKYEAKGNLSIRGITKGITLPFNLKIENGHASMEAALNINRTTYKIGTGMWASKDWVEHIININIHLEAKQNK